MGILGICKMCEEAEILNEDNICQSCAHDGSQVYEEMEYVDEE